MGPPWPCLGRKYTPKPESGMASVEWSVYRMSFKNRFRTTYPIALGLIINASTGWPDTVQGLHKLKELAIIATLSNGNVRLLVDMVRVLIAF